MTAMPKNVSKKSVIQTSKTPSVVESMRSLGQLDYDTANRTARKTQDVTQTADQHSTWSRNRSEDYHARIIGPAVPIHTGAEKMESPRPGLTAQRGLGG